MMRKMMLLTVVLAGVAAAQASTGDFVMHARVSYTDGGAMIKGSSDADWSYAAINTLVLQGDTLWLDREGALEVEFAGGSFLRVADGSKAEVAALPPSGAVRAWFGAFYLHRTSRSPGDFVVETPAGTVSVPGDSQVRFDIDEHGATTVTVRWGRAQVRTPHGGATTVRDGQRVFVDPGLLPSTPVAFDRTLEDAFDAWNRERVTLLATGGVLPEVVSASSQPMGVADLGRYGDWVYVDNTRYWRPTVIVDYVPYRYGHWSYVPVYGYTWVGHQPFDYVTSHYGRWTYHSRHGWLWVYRDTWGPAWVASVRYGPNFVWAPLDPYGRPVVVGSYFTVGGVRFGYSTTTWSPVSRVVYGYAPAFPATTTIVNPIYANEVHIWNININIPGSSGRRRPDFGRALEVRDYSPQRVIRGPDTVDPRRPRAATVVQALETSRGRSSFDTTRVREVRQTSTASQGRRADVRSVRVSEETIARTREEQSGVERRMRSEDAARVTRAASPRPEGTPDRRAPRVSTDGALRTESGRTGLRAPSAATEPTVPPVVPDARRSERQTRTRTAPPEPPSSPLRTVIRDQADGAERTRVRADSADRATRGPDAPTVPESRTPALRTPAPEQRQPTTRTITRQQPERTRPESRPQTPAPRAPSAPDAAPRVRTAVPSTERTPQPRTAAPERPVAPQRTAPQPTAPRVSAPEPPTRRVTPQQPQTVPRAPAPEPPTRRVAPAQPQTVPRAPAPEPPTRRIAPERPQAVPRAPAPEPSAPRVAPQQPQREPAQRVAPQERRSAPSIPTAPSPRAASPQRSREATRQDVRAPSSAPAPRGRAIVSDAGRSAGERAVRGNR